MNKKLTIPQIYKLLDETGKVKTPHGKFFEYQHDIEYIHDNGIVIIHLTHPEKWIITNIELEQDQIKDCEEAFTDLYKIII